MSVDTFLPPEKPVLECRPKTQREDNMALCAHRLTQVDLVALSASAIIELPGRQIQ